MNSTPADPVALLEREDRMVWKGVVAEFLLDETRMIDFEGAFRVGKTTAALRKVLRSCIKYPGIQWLICRYSDGDTQTKLKPPWRTMCRNAGVKVQWDSAEMCDVFPCIKDGEVCTADSHKNCGGKQSRVYIFGVKSQDQTSRYGKFRGMTLGGIYNDQTEELPHDVFLEMTGRLSQNGYPHQLLLTPNPPDENHWLTREFPEDNHLRGRKYYSAPIHANAHNLPAETIPGLIQAYPPSHPKHRSAVLGKRGLNVIGDPVYGGEPEKGIAPMFVPELHKRPLEYNPHLPLLTAIDFGKHHPCAIFGQFTPWNQFLVLGGLMGQTLFLEDFAPVVLRYRSEWFPNVLQHLECCDPAGAHDNSQGVRNNGVKVLQDHGIHPTYKENSNAPDVRLAMIERIAGYMRKRTPRGEAFGIESRADKWIIVSPDFAKPWNFAAAGFEAGYVWDDHFVSVGSKQIRKAKKDGWYEHAQNCCEYLELNYGGAQPTVQQVERHAEKVHAGALKRAQQDRDPYDERMRPGSQRRGGY
jgi:hypothetical protein